MEPDETLVILITTDQVDTGTVVEGAVSSSATVLLSGSNTSEALNFDIDAGWSPVVPNDSNITINPASTQLAPILIIPRS